MNFRVSVFAALSAIFLADPGMKLGAQDKPAPAKPKFTDPEAPSVANLSLKKEIERSIGRALKWLMTQQDKNGFWSEEEHPAVTAMAVSAILRDPRSKKGDPISVEVERALGYILSNAKSDGGIYGDDGLATYNTSLAVMALLDADRKQYDTVLLAANRFLVGLQHDFGEQGKADSPHDGGIGYGGSYKHSDMSNTQLSLQALRALKKKFEHEEERRDLDLDWEAAIAFVSRCQQLPETNKADWVSKDPKDKGGVVYFPGNSKAEEKLPDGKVAMRSYGSMTYAGLLSFIYADMKRDDKRVVAALDWLKSNYTLKENPGLGEQGLYYYYHTMAKALAAYGAPEMTLTGGKKIDWRKTLALHMFNLQNSDGRWANENGRWWEKDPVLVTCYAILTLEEIHRSL